MQYRIEFLVSLAIYLLWTIQQLDIAITAQIDTMAMHCKHCNVFSLEMDEAADEESKDKKKECLSNGNLDCFFFFAANELYLFKFNNFALLFLLFWMIRAVERSLNPNIIHSVCWEMRSFCICFFHIFFFFFVNAQRCLHEHWTLNDLNSSRFGCWFKYVQCSWYVAYL